MKKKIKILVTNDDGAGAPGLKLLTAAAKLLGQVHVVVPPCNLTGAGSAHHLSGRFVCKDNTLFIQISSRDLLEAASPVDCVRYGMARFKPDLVLVGINNGLNVGVNTMCSGTVCAAAMACQLGAKQALALSMHKPDWTAWSPKQVAKVIKILLPGLYRQVAYNVNMPPKAPKEISEDSIHWKDEEGGFKNVYPLPISRNGHLQPGVISNRDDREFSGDKIFSDDVYFVS